MKKILFLTILLLVSGTVFSQLDCTVFNPSQLASASVDYNVDGVIETDIGELGAIEQFDANIRVVPQHVTDPLNYYPSSDIAVQSDDYGNTVLNIYKEEISDSEIEWGLSTIIYPKKNVVAIPNNPEFPYDKDEFSEEVQEYLEYTEIANVNPEIIDKANELVGGVDNYLDAVSILSDFVAYHIIYDLSYSDPDTTACEVFETRRGVCGAFSALLVSMLRTVGIPARFVSGYAFTNIGEVSCSNFIAHSWIEVYIPGSGWIPIDPTFKEFFWVNAGHVELYKSKDLSTSLINATATYHDATIEPKKPSFSFEMTDYELSEQVLPFTASFSHDEVGENDFVIINVTINNSFDGWLLDSIILSKTYEMSMVYNNETIPVFIPPNSLKSYYYIVKTPDGLDPNLLYTHPFAVTLGSGGMKTLDLKVNPRKEISTNFTELLLTVKGERVYTTDFSISNMRVVPNKVLDENPVLFFDLINNGNTPVRNISVEINYFDKKVEDTISILGIGEVKVYEKTLPLPSASGIIPVNISVYDSNHSASSSTSFSVIGEPPFSFSISGPEVWQRNADYPVNLSFSRIPVDFTNGIINIYVNNELYSTNDWYFGKTQLFIPQNEFELGNNTVKISISYDDSYGNSYYTEASFSFEKKIYEDSFTRIIIGIADFLKAIIDIIKLLIGL